LRKQLLVHAVFNHVAPKLPGSGTDDQTHRPTEDTANNAAYNGTQKSAEELAAGDIVNFLLIQFTHFIPQLSKK
jgi:hypothetical protein